MRSTRWVPFLVLCGAAVVSISAGAQPAVAPLSSQGDAAVTVTAAGPVSSMALDVPSYDLMESQSGTFVDLPGLAFKDCSADAGAEMSVEGPLVAPFVHADADLSAVEQGSFGSAGICRATGGSFVRFEFAFHSPTFAAIGGEFLPIAFTFSGDASASGSCFGPTGCFASTTTSFLSVGSSGFGFAQILALESGPTSIQMNEDFVGDMNQAWVVAVEADAFEVAGPGTPGVPDGGSSMADVTNLLLEVDFGLTETLIKAANPALTQTTIDQGLADLELIVSPGVDLGLLAPQFVPEPGQGTMLLAGAALLLRLSRRARL